MTKFDVYVENISARRYEDRIASLNEQLLIGVKTRSREDTLAELDGVLCAFAPVRATVTYQKGELRSV